MSFGNLRKSSARRTAIVLAVGLSVVRLSRMVYCWLDQRLWVRNEKLGEERTQGLLADTYIGARAIIALFADTPSKSNKWHII